MADVIIRPVSAVSGGAWLSNEASGIDDAIINPSTSSDSVFVRAVRDGESDHRNTTQSYLLGEPEGDSSQAIATATLNMYGGYTSVPAEDFTVEIVVGGDTQRTERLAFDVEFSFHWKTAIWPSTTLTLASFSACQVNLNALDIRANDELRFDVVYLALTPAVSDTSGASALATNKTQALALLASITENPKPSYVIDGQVMDWGEYLQAIQANIDFLDKQSNADNPAGRSSTGYT